ncbi:hypothetical protein BpHYR1_007534 [Brachionus plicatilis]|uniref:Uncharacterized protein n=1 Tax=Brachionus plicatilis TaxID=10195 RepID=A0A3M7Q1S5_BRAPC|nr:hypothetical protein BpHYR1_007534 [Brachionus plicatilis]
MNGFQPSIRYFFCHLIQTRPLDLLYIRRTNIIPSLTYTIKRIKFQTGLRDGGKFVGMTVLYYIFLLSIYLELYKS